MNSLGFGLERIGLAVLRAPVPATLIVLVTLVLAALTIPGLQFYGQAVGIVDRNSPAYDDYDRQALDFRDTDQDVAIIFKGPSLMQAATLDGLRDLHLDLTLADNVDQVFSVFSLGGFTDSGRTFEPFLPDRFDTDAAATGEIERLLAETPEARGLIAPEASAALLIVSLDIEKNIAESELRDLLATLRSQVIQATPQGLEVLFAGMPSVRVAVVEAIISDQTLLTAAGVLLGATVSYLIFGNVISALICTLPGIIAVIWLMSFFSLSGVKLNFITTVLPSLALIIAFADGVVLYFRWQSLSAGGGDRLEHLKQAILQVGPASALTSITTALAFLSFGYTSSETMQIFAWFGVAAVFLAFIAVIAGLPLACYWSLRFGTRRKKARSPFARLGPGLARLSSGRPAITVTAALGLLAVLAVGHLSLQPSYNLTADLPSKSEIRSGETFLSETFGATSQMFLIVPVAPGTTFSDARNRDRIVAVDRALSELLGAGRVASLAAIWKRAGPEQIAAIAATIDDLEPSVRGRLLSSDGQAMQVTITATTGQDTDVDAELLAAIRAAVEKTGPADDLTFTGMRVVMAEEFPKLINELRTGLLIAVFLAVGFVVLASRNLRLGLATLVPNLLPILLTESIILMFGKRLDITNVIALTIAFGIAIDNAVHIINGYTHGVRQGRTPNRAIHEAIVEIGPALVASTAILCVATVITQFSSLPSVTVLGRLLIVTLIVALGSNLIILPGFIRLLSGEKNDT